MYQSTINYGHRIGDVFFLTITDVDLPDLRDQGLNCYQTPVENPNVIQLIHGVNRNSLTLSLLTQEERSQISKCLVTSEITDDSQIFFPVIIRGQEENLISYMSGFVENLDVPLLRSPEVREQLNSSLSHSNQVVLVIHSFFIEIRDFFTHQLDIFYVSEFVSSLQYFSTRDSIERMFRLFLPDFNGMLIHSSVVKRNGKAVFFLAPNGGGKTSIARQAPAESVLSDDQTILRMEKGKFLAYSTPWGRIVNIPQSIPLGGFFLIEKAKQFELMPVNSRQMLSFLWNEHFPFSKFLPKSSRISAFNLLYQAVSNVPLYLMQTPLDGVEWDRIDSCL